MRERSEVSQLIAGEAGKSFVRELVQTQQLARVAALWCRDCDVDWMLLHRDAPRQRVAFPGYPFASELCDLYAALRVDAPRRAAADETASAAVPVPVSGAIEGPALPQAWFASRLSDRKAVALSKKQMKAFWASETASCTESGSLLTALGLIAGESQEEAFRTLAGHCLVERQPGSDTVAALQACTQRLEISLETLIAAGWALLINRHTKATAPEFGWLRSAGSDRESPLPPLPVRIQAVGRQKIAPWLAAIEEQLAQRLDHAGTAPGQIAPWTRGIAPFESALILTDPATDTVPATATVSASEARLVDDLFAAHPTLHLALWVQVEAHGLHLRLGYRADNLPAAPLEPLLEQLEILLEGLASHPDRNPAALTMRSKHEGRKAFWNTLEQLNPQEQAQ